MTSIGLENKVSVYFPTYSVLYLTPTLLITGLNVFKSKGLPCACEICEEDKLTMKKKTTFLISWVSSYYWRLLFTHRLWALTDTGQAWLVDLSRARSFNKALSKESHYTWRTCQLIQQVVKCTYLGVNTLRHPTVIMGGNCQHMKRDACLCEASLDGQKLFITKLPKDEET